MVAYPPRSPPPPHPPPILVPSTPSPPQSPCSVDSHTLVHTWLNFQSRHLNTSTHQHLPYGGDGLVSRSASLHRTKHPRADKAFDGPSSTKRRCLLEYRNNVDIDEVSVDELHAGSYLLPKGGAGYPTTPVHRVLVQPGTDSPQPPPDSDVDYQTSQSEDQEISGLYGIALANSSMPPPNKRKSNSKSSSPSKTGSNLSDTRRKRQALSFTEPSGTFGIPDLADLGPEDPRLLPREVRSFIKRFSTGSFEACCVPSTPEINEILGSLFDHEDIPTHARIAVTSSTEASRALALFNFARELHRGCLRNSRRALDEATWYPFVRGLLSVVPPSGSSVIPSAPPSYDPVPTTHDLFLTVDATTKCTVTSLPPTGLTIKVDALIAFNPDHSSIKPRIRRALRTGIRLNAFNDVSLIGSIIALAVEVKPSGGGGGEMEAEYQLGVYGMKTLGLVGQHTKVKFVPSVSVCGHTWSLHVTYETQDEFVTHGPITIGATDSLYGTLKIVSFVCRLKEWAAKEMWESWVEVLDSAA